MLFGLRGLVVSDSRPIVATCSNDTLPASAASRYSIVWMSNPMKCDVSTCEASGAWRRLNAAGLPETSCAVVVDPIASRVARS